MQRALTLFILMIIASASAFLLHPTIRIADQYKATSLETMIPKQFGDWQSIEFPSNQLVNPEQNELVKKIYTEVLSRIYVKPDGTRVMLTIAYGKDQSDGMALHYPEVCYPAQGFQISEKFNDEIQVNNKTIPVKRLVAYQGQRNEPITYWTMLGSKAVRGGTQAKWEQIKFGMHGLIPDGLLFRVSSIDTNNSQSFEAHNSFVNDLANSLNPVFKKRVTGI